MKLEEFLAAAAETIQGWTEDEYKAFVYAQAREVPENKRKAFLTSLKKIRGKDAALPFAHAKNTLTRQYHNILSKVDRIQDEDQPIIVYSMAGMLGESGYDVGDPMHVLDTVQKGCDLVISLADAGMDEEAGDLAERLLELNIKIDGDYALYHGDRMRLSELGMRVDGLHVDDMALDGAVCAYRAAKDDAARAGKVLSILEGAELAGLGSFKKRLGETAGYEGFLRALCTQAAGDDSDIAESILEEALKELQDPAFALRTVQTEVKNHPDLFLKYIRKESSPAKRAAAIGQALEEISDRDIRIEFLEAEADAAGEDGDRRLLKECLLELFQTGPSVASYLHLTETFPETKTEHAEEIAEVCSRLTGNKKIGLDFVQGNFEDAVQKVSNPGDARDWDRGNLGMYTTLLLVLLTEGKKLPDGITSLVPRYVETGDDEDLPELLARWKKENPPEQSFADRVIPLLEKLVTGVTDTVFAKRNKDVYEDCADFMCGLGEMEESRKIRTENEVLAAYAARYASRKTFIRVLMDAGYTPSEA